MAKLEKNESEKTISTLRKSIDKIDETILDLINRRLLLAKEIGGLKEQKGSQVLDNTRENAIMNRLYELNTGPLTNKVLYHIFSDIMATSREIQKSQVITYLGPEATFTHIAAMNHFGPSVSFVPQTDIRDIFSEVEKGTCDYGIVPVENSIEGAVTHTLDLFFESDLKICAERYQTISHDLLSTSDKCSSTAHAAQMAAAKSGTAAIASSEAAHMYNLHVVASKIEDFSRNVTRFLIIGTDEMHRTGRDKTSLMFVISHVPGALFKILEPIYQAEINMVKLESRPTKHENWSYFFFVDLEGHIEDPNVKETVAKMKDLCLYLKCLGSYPRARTQ
ncbi:MAG: chorismate mutase [Deltaproteobacteria bacterium]|nr:chorismate mutase [Deltaproteobacteria bacterium]